jgi:hypothetical protein
MKLSIILLISFALVLSSCKVKKEVEENTDVQVQQNVTNTNQHTNNNGSDDVVDGSMQMVGPPVIIYKTKEDYFNNVPVILSDDKSKVMSYPGIHDVKTNEGEFQIPLILDNGYLLDQRGINENVAFTKYTYAIYANLDNTPSAEELFEVIIDADPLSEMYFCGSRFSFENPKDEINQIIKSGDMSKFKKIK